MIHPVAGTAFLHSRKPNAIYGEGLAYELIEIDSRNQYVPSIEVWLRRYSEFDLDGIMDCLVEESDLPLVVFLEAKVAVSTNALPGHAFGFGWHQYGVFASWLAMMAHEIVVPRKVDG